MCFLLHTCTGNYISWLKRLWLDPITPLCKINLIAPFIANRQVATNTRYFTVNMQWKSLIYLTTRCHILVQYFPFKDVIFKSRLYLWKIFTCSLGSKGNIKFLNCAWRLDPSILYPKVSDEINSKSWSAVKKNGQMLNLKALCMQRIEWN